MTSDFNAKREANAATRMYLFEHFKEIDNERTKASYLLAFEGLIFAELLQWMQPAPTWCKTGFVTLAGLAMLATVVHLFFPTPAALYGDYSGIFAPQANQEHFLDDEFRSLQQQRVEALRIAARSRHWNQMAFVLLAVSLIFPVAYFFLPTI